MVCLLARCEPAHPTTRRARVQGWVALRAASLHAAAIKQAGGHGQRADAPPPGLPRLLLQVCWFLLALQDGNRLAQSPALQAGKVRACGGRRRRSAGCGLSQRQLQAHRVCRCIAPRLTKPFFCLQTGCAAGGLLHGGPQGRADGAGGRLGTGAREPRLDAAHAGAGLGAREGGRAVVSRRCTGAPQWVAFCACAVLAGGSHAVTNPAAGTAPRRSQHPRCCPARPSRRPLSRPCSSRAWTEARWIAWAPAPCWCWPCPSGTAASSPRGAPGCGLFGADGVGASCQGRTGGQQLRDACLCKPRSIGSAAGRPANRLSACMPRHQCAAPARRSPPRLSACWAHPWCTRCRATWVRLLHCTPCLPSVAALPLALLAEWLHHGCRSRGSCLAGVHHSIPSDAALPPGLCCRSGSAPYAHQPVAVPGAPAGAGGAAAAGQGPPSVSAAAAECEVHHPAVHSTATTAPATGLPCCCHFFFCASMTLCCCRSPDQNALASCCQDLRLASECCANGRGHQGSGKACQPEVRPASAPASCLSRTNPRSCPAPQSPFTSPAVCHCCAVPQASATRSCWERTLQRCSSCPAATGGTCRCAAGQLSPGSAAGCASFACHPWPAVHRALSLAAWLCATPCSWLTRLARAWHPMLCRRLCGSPTRGPDRTDMCSTPGRCACDDMWNAPPRSRGRTGQPASGPCSLLSVPVASLLRAIALLQLFQPQQHMIRLHSASLSTPFCQVICMAPWQPLGDLTGVGSLQVQFAVVGGAECMQ